MTKQTNAVWEMFRPGDTLARKLVKDNLLDQVDELRRRVRAQEFLSPGVPSLDYLSDDLGDVHAGRFICGEGDIDGTDFTGMAIMYPPRNGYNLGGFNNGTMMVGISAADGKLYAAAGSLVIDLDAITMSGLNYAFQHTASVGEIGVDCITRLGMWQASGIMNAATMYLDHEREVLGATERIANGGFETGDKTNWTESGSGSGSIHTPAPEGSYYYKMTLDPGETLTATSGRGAVDGDSLYGFIAHHQMSFIGGQILTGEIRVKWYDAASGGNLLRTDTFALGAPDTWVMRNTFLMSPSDAESVEVQLYGDNDAAATSTGYCFFDGISIIQRNMSRLWGDPGFLVDGWPLGLRAIPEDHEVPNPPAGFYRIYPKTDDKLYLMESNGTEHEVGSGSGGGIEVSEYNATSAFNTTDTTVIASKTVSGGSMGSTGIVKAEVWVYYRQNTGSTRQFTYTFTFGGTTISDTINVSSWADSSKYAVAKFEFVVQNIGSASAQRMAALVHDGGADVAGDLATGIGAQSGFQTASENTASDKNMKIEIAMSVASSNFGFYTLGARFFGPS